MWMQSDDTKKLEDCHPRFLLFWVIGQDRIWRTHCIPTVRAFTDGTQGFWIFTMRDGAGVIESRRQHSLNVSVRSG